MGRLPYILIWLAFSAGLPAAEVPVVVAGGVSGAADLAVARNSAAFRAAGGGLYLHNSGWGQLNATQRLGMLRLFGDRPLGIELGFKPSGKAWAMIYRRDYMIHGLKPLFIAANAFDGNNHPTPAQWTEYMMELRKAGVPRSTSILPTFEYANFGPNIRELAHNKVSDRDDFRKILAVAGGIVIDCPPGFFFSREQNYRDWVVDALHWCRKNHLLCVVIISPHTYGNRFPGDTRRFVIYMRRHDAMPDIWVCENYSVASPEHYANRVGSENAPANVLGTARLLLTEYLKPETAAGKGPAW